MNILAIGAHPDDIELGCGGTLLKAARQGHNVFMYTLTRGGSAGKVIRRSNESVNSAMLIGASALWIDDYEDTKVYLTKELIDSIEFFIKKTKADIIYTHPLRDNHHDHRAIAEATVEAGRFTPSIFGYENPSTRNFNPVMFYDISDVIDEKNKFINMYGSQESKIFIGSNSVKGLSEFRAIQTRLDEKIVYMEAFEVMKISFEANLTLLRTRKIINEELKIPKNVIEFILEK
ncbi:MAG: PIG-L family deacetylase [Nitrosopumilus sp.]|nr:PIG-L family deacetylase [Nitrosopumilus sp.]